MPCRCWHQRSGGDPGGHGGGLCHRSVPLPDPAVVGAWAVELQEDQQDDLLLLLQGGSTLGTFTIVEYGPPPPKMGAGKNSTLLFSRGMESKHSNISLFSINVSEDYLLSLCPEPCLRNLPICLQCLHDLQRAVHVQRRLHDALQRHLHGADSHHHWNFRQGC